jgi:hypothetical protein
VLDVTVHVVEAQGIRISVQGGEPSRSRRAPPAVRSTSRAAVQRRVPHSDHRQLRPLGRSGSSAFSRRRRRSSQSCRRSRSENEAWRSIIPSSMAPGAASGAREQRGDLSASAQLRRRRARAGIQRGRADEDGNVRCRAGLRGARREPAAGPSARRLCDRLGGVRRGPWRPAMSAITHAIRGVIEGAGYARIDMLVAEDFPAAQRYAEALGFKRETTIYTRRARRRGEHEMGERRVPPRSECNCGDAMFERDLRAVARTRLRRAWTARTRAVAAAGRAQRGGHAPPRPRGPGRGDRGAGRGRRRHRRRKRARPHLSERARSRICGARPRAYNGQQEARGYRFRASQEKAAAKNAIIGGAAITGIQQAQNAKSADANFTARQNAYFPGGQRLPVPSGGYSPPPYNANGGW